MGLYSRLGKTGIRFLGGLSHSKATKNLAKDVVKVGGNSKVMKTTGKLISKGGNALSGGSTHIIRSVRKTAKAGKHIPATSKKTIPHMFNKLDRNIKNGVKKAGGMVYNPVKKVAGSSLLLGGTAGLLSLGGINLYDKFKDVHSITDEERQFDRDNKLIQDRNDIMGGLKNLWGNSAIGSGVNPEYSGTGFGSLPSFSDGSDVQGSSFPTGTLLIIGGIGGLSYLGYKHFKKSKKSKKSKPKSTKK